MGHRAAAHLALADGLFQFAEFRFREVVDLRGDPRGGASEKSKQRHQIGDAVPGGVPAGVRRAQTEDLHGPGLNFHALLPPGGEGADGAGHVSHEVPLLCLQQPVALAAQLVQPDRHLESQGDGQGLLAVRSADHQGPAVFVHQRQQGPHGRGELFFNNGDRVLGADHLSGIDDVLRRCPEMKETGGFLPKHGPEFSQQADEAVPRDLAPRLDRLQIQEIDLRAVGDLLRRLLGNDSQISLGKGQSRLHIYPRLEAGLFFKDSPHFGRGSGIAEEYRVQQMY